jgi:UDP-glucose 4-epimerase
MVVQDVEQLVFSSSPAVCGAPDLDEVGEDTKRRSVNPYGLT